MHNFLILTVIIWGSIAWIYEPSQADQDTAQIYNLARSAFDDELNEVRSEISYSGPGQLDQEALNNKNLRILLSGQEVCTKQANIWKNSIEKIFVVRREYQVFSIYKMNENYVISLQESISEPIREEKNWIATLIVMSMILNLAAFILAANLSVKK